MSIERALTPRFLHLVLRDSTGAPLANRPFHIVFPDAEPLTGTTDGGGRLSTPVPAGAETATLTVAYRSFALRLDALAPVTHVAGVQARLNHLNFFAGAVDGVHGPRTTAALRAFQAAHALDASGALDAATLDCLTKTYSGQ